MPVPTTLAPAAVEPPQPQPVSREPWVWYHDVTPAIARGLMNEGVSNIAVQRVAGARRRYVAEVKRDGLELRREEVTASDALERVAWVTSIPGVDLGSTNAVVLAEPRSTDVVVAWRTDAGYALRRYSADGVLRWDTAAADPDPLAPGAFMVQLQAAGTAVVVYNRRESGAYLDEINFETGHSMARASVDPAVLSSGFEWPPRNAIRGRRLGYSWPGPDGSYVVRKRDDALVVEHAGSDGKRRWSTTLDARGAAWWNSAALLVHRETVVVVAYHGSSSGAVAYGLTRRDGAKRYDASPGSIGSIGHSKYTNDLALTLDAVGHVLTHANESAGRYIGVLDVDAGRLLGREVWRN